LDVNEFDAASNRGVEEIRDIRDKVHYAPTEARYKVYIIDEVHMLTEFAFNALLKTLEEPPAHVIFVLATTEPHKVPMTIQSRCQRYDFHRITPMEQAKRMRMICDAEGVTVEEEALAIIARLSEGAMRDALSLLDQAIAYTGNQVTAKSITAMTGVVSSDYYASLLWAIMQGNAGQVLEFTDRIMREGMSAEKCLEGLVTYLRDLLLLKLAPDSRAIKDRLSSSESERLQQIVAGIEVERLFQMIDTSNIYMNEMKYALQPQAVLDVALLKLCVEPSISNDKLRQDNPYDPSPIFDEIRKLTTRVEQLEQRRNEVPKEIPKQAVPLRAFTPIVSEISGTVLQPFLKERNAEDLQRVVQQWPELLRRLKERRVQTYAWLVDGEPVAATMDKVLIGFKNEIHREATTKPTNKELIESMMTELFGKPSVLVAVLTKEWQAAEHVAAGMKESNPPEVLELIPDDEDLPSEPKHKEEWIRDAIDLFGEDLVVVKE
jgi:DNA polymerase-3 subunit gamma/tau